MDKASHTVPFSVLTFVGRVNTLPPMQIGLDLRPFLKEETGIGVYFKNLLISLAAIDQDNEYYMLSSSLKSRFSKEKIPPFVRGHFRDLPLPSRGLDWLWIHYSRPTLDAVFRTRLDVTHSATPLPLPTLGKTIITIHDLFYLDNPDMVDKDTRTKYLKYTEDSIQKSDGIIAVSCYTRDEILKRFAIHPDKVKVIYHGMSKRFKVKLSTAFRNVMRQKYNLPDRYILSVGAIEPRKNFPALVEALKRVHEQNEKIVLIIAGRKGSDFQNLQNKIDQCQLQPWVRVLDYLPDEDVQGLYALTTLFVLPSLCEGFGFPLLEAMACDIPIVSSHAAALPEVAQAAASYFDPRSVEDMAHAITRVLNDESLRASLIKNGQTRTMDFDWDDTARETLAFYQTVLERKPE